MSRFTGLVFLAVVFGLGVESLPGQIGRGRILRQIREDLFGSPQANAEKARQAQIAKERAAQAAKVQLEQQRRALQAKQQAAAGKNTRQPTPRRTATPSQAEYRKVWEQQQRAQQQQQRAQQAGTRPTPTRTPTARTPARAPTTRTANRVGFGMELVEKGEKLIVGKVDPQGNAALKGIRPGDTILSIGGVEVARKSTFDEIAEILSPGDNIEIGFVGRSGKDQELQVAFGNAPDDIEDSIVEAPRTRGQQTSARRPDFAPPRTGANGDVTQLNNIVSQQQRVIRDLENQIRTLRQQQKAPVRAPVTRPGSVLSGPALNAGS